MNSYIYHGLRDQFETLSKKRKTLEERLLQLDLGDHQPISKIKASETGLQFDILGVPIKTASRTILREQDLMLIEYEFSYIWKDKNSAFFSFEFGKHAVIELPVDEIVRQVDIKERDFPQILGLALVDKLLASPIFQPSMAPRAPKAGIY